MRIFAVLAFCVLAYGQTALQFESAIPLPGVDGRIDHLSADPAGKRLFLSALGSNAVEVVDLAAGKILQSLSGMAEPQGIAYVADARKIYVANGKSGKVLIFDAATLKPAGEVALGDDADNVRYEPSHKRVWVGYQDGALGALDIATGKRAGDIFLDAHPESFQLAKAGPRIFVNVPDAGEVEVVDRDKKVVVAKWPVKNAAANFPMALDEGNHRLFLGCRKPAKVLVLDTESGKVVAEFVCPGDTDDLFYDSARKRLYVAGGAGSLEAFEQKSPDQYASIAKVATAAGARTALFIPELNRIYVAVPHRGSQAAEVRIYRVE